MRTSLTAIAAFCLSLVSANAADPPLPADVFAGAPFKIVLASGATTNKQQGPDFDVYHVSWGTSGHLGLYEGCCPQTFLAGPDIRKAEISINGAKAREARHESGGQLSREVHITLARQGTTSTLVVHAWYKTLGADDARIADQMIASIAGK